MTSAPEIMPEPTEPADAPALDAGDGDNLPTLSRLTVGALALSPDFDPEVNAYTAETTNATNRVRAEASDPEDQLTITLNGTEIENGSAAAWIAGENVLEIVVSDGQKETRYTVTVRK